MVAKQFALSDHFVLLGYSEPRLAEQDLLGTARHFLSEA